MKKGTAMSITKLRIEKDDGILIIPVAHIIRIRIFWEPDTHAVKTAIIDMRDGISRPFEDAAAEKVLEFVNRYSTHESTYFIRERGKK